MAKRSILDHPKFTELQEVLGQPKGAVLGWLECLWHFTAKFTPQGNIGKYTDKQIERWVEWNGNAGDLIKALVQTKWVDESGEHRLVIHDWHDHCDDSVKKTLKRNGLVCVSGHVQTKDGHVLDTRRLPVPSLAMPSHANASANASESPTDFSIHEDFVGPIPKQKEFVNPIEDFEEDVQAEARKFWQLFCVQHHGSMLRNLHSEATHKELRHFAKAITAHGEQAVEKLNEYYKSPPKADKGLAAWQVILKLGLNSSVETKKKEPPWEAAKKQADEEGRRKLHETVARLNKEMAC